MYGLKLNRIFVTAQLFTMTLYVLENLYTSTCAMKWVKQMIKKTNTGKLASSGEGGKKETKSIFIENIDTTF